MEDEGHSKENKIYNSINCYDGVYMLLKKKKSTPDGWNSKEKITLAERRRKISIYWCWYITDVTNSNGEPDGDGRVGGWPGFCSLKTKKYKQIKKKPKHCYKWKALHN